MGLWSKARQVLNATATGPASASPRDLFVAQVEAEVRRMPRVSSVRRSAESLVSDVESRDVLWVPWDALVEAAADCLALEPEMSPPRWRTVRWLAPDAIAKLRATAIASPSSTGSR